MGSDCISSWSLLIVLLSIAWSQKSMNLHMQRGYRLSITHKYQENTKFTLYSEASRKIPTKGFIVKVGNELSLGFKPEDWDLTAMVDSMSNISADNTETLLLQSDETSKHNVCIKTFILVSLWKPIPCFTKGKLQALSSLKGRQFFTEAKTIKIPQ